MNREFTAFLVSGGLLAAAAHAATAPPAAAPNSALPPPLGTQPVQGCDIAALNDQIKQENTVAVILKSQRNTYAAALSADQAKLRSLTGSDDATQKQRAALQAKIASETSQIAALDMKTAEINVMIDRIKATLAHCERSSSRNLQRQQQRPGGKP